MNSKYLMVARSKWLLAVGCLMLGAAIILGIRLATYKPEEEIHYHANFAVYVNGQREKFAAPNYYEEEAAITCSASDESAVETTPMSRVHMHGNVNDVIHVEDARVTWGNFFTVLGWNIGGTYLATRDTVYQNSDQAKVTFMLNGKQVQSVTNTVISDQDKLLVNYGAQTSEQLRQEYSQIKNNARAADQSTDPAGCGGNHVDATSITERMRHML